MSYIIQEQILAWFLQGGAAATNNSLHLMFIALIFIIMWFFMIRPQSKRVKDQKSFIEDLQQGDRVVTIGGIHGKINKVNESTVTLDIGNNNRIKVEKDALSFEFSKNVSQASKDKKEK